MRLLSHDYLSAYADDYGTTGKGAGVRGQESGFRFQVSGFRREGERESGKQGSGVLV
jgi:hypothetical protein